MALEKVRNWFGVAADVCYTIHKIKEHCHDRNKNELTGLSLIDEQIQNLAGFARQEGQPKYGINHTETPVFVADSFESVVKPVIEWLARSQHPHHKIIIEDSVAELLEGKGSYRGNTK